MCSSTGVDSMPGASELAQLVKVEVLEGMEEVGAKVRSHSTSESRLGIPES